MKSAVIIASGQSLRDEDVEYIRLAHVVGKIDYVLAVSNVGIDKAPWADALVSGDSNWWNAYPNALKFKGRKFSSRGYSRTELFDTRFLGYSSGVNSGLLAMFIARDIYKVDKIFLIGFDMHGSHYFGPHVAKHQGGVLTNSDERLFKKHLQQFDRFEGCEVYNVTKGSALKKFPFTDLKKVI